DSPRALLAGLGREVIELRVQHDPQQVLGLLRSHRIAGDDTFAVGSTLTIPLRNGTAGEAMAQISELNVATTAISTRPPTLDDVYLRLTGDRLAAWGVSMTTITATDRIPVRTRRRPGAGQDNLSALLTLARRRLALSASNPREIFVPLLTPLLFALVIAPAMATLVRSAPGLDYRTYLAIGTAGLLVPLACMFAGLGVVVDRQSGARRELLTAPIPRGLIVFGNLLVAVLVSGLQLGALLLATYL